MNKGLLVLLAIFFLCSGCSTDIKQDLLNYAEKKYDKQFDVLAVTVGQYDLLMGKQASSITLTNKDDNFCFKVIYYRNEYSDDYLNAYYGTLLVKGIVNSLVNKDLKITDVSYIGYLDSNYITDYIAEENPQFNKKDHLNIVIAFKSPEIFMDSDFEKVLQTLYNDLYESTFEYLLQLLCIKSECYEVIPSKLKQVKYKNANVILNDFDNILKYSVEYGSIPEYTPSIENVKQCIIKY